MHEQPFLGEAEGALLASAPPLLPAPRLQNGVRCSEARVPEFAAAMRVVMMPGSTKQAEVFTPIKSLSKDKNRAAGTIACTCASGQRSAAQHSTAQHSAAQHSAAQHSTAQHSTAQHSTAQAYQLHCLCLVMTGGLRPFNLQLTAQPKNNSALSPLLLLPVLCRSGVGGAALVEREWGRGWGRRR